MKNNPRSIDVAGDFFMPNRTGQTLSDLESEFERANHALLQTLDHELGANTQLNEALHHHFNAGGGRVRMSLALDAGRRLGLPNSDRHHLALATELLHNASLIHDDLQDQDPVRRGQPAVWSAYGSDVAILAGDYLLATAFGQLAHCKRQSPTLIQHFQKRSADLIFGQALDLSFSEASENFSLDTYRQIVSAKSGALLAMPLELALIASGHTQAVASARGAGEAFAIAYQISDDLSDIEADARHDCFNIIHALLQSEGNDSLHAAITEGQIQCQHAIDKARTLPKHCGELMVEKAQQLMVQFQEVAET